MAFTKEYDVAWTSNRNLSGTIEIQRDGASYQGSLTLLKESLEIKRELPSWEDQIIRQNCSFAVVNQESDWFDMIELMTAGLGKRKILVYQDTDSSTPSLLFEGYLNVETITQPIYEKSIVRFTASSLLNKLQFLHPSSIDTLQTLTLIDLIDDCLVLTGSNYNIRVNCSLYESDASLGTGQTLFNRTGIFTEVFWEDNIQRMNALDIIKNILKPFDCYLYWYNECWYIERYMDLHETSKTYVEYTTGTSYGYADSGSEVSESIQGYQIHGSQFKQVFDSQRLGVKPGLRKITIRGTEKQYFNLLNADLSETINHTDDFPLPAYREWYTYDPAIIGDGYGWGYKGERFRGIANGIRRIGYSTNSGADYTRGLSTLFRFSITDDTELTLKWSIAITNMANIPGQFLGNEDKYDLRLYWWLAEGNSFFYYNESLGQWAVATGTPQDYVQRIDLRGSDLDSDLLSYRVEITIPVGEIFATSSAYQYNARTVRFGIGHERFVRSSVIYGDVDEPSDSITFGDVFAATTDSPETNLVEGVQNTDFLDELEIDVLVYDVTNWGFRNGLVLSPYDLWSIRTDEWTDSTGADTLMRKLLETKFRQHNESRQKIEMVYDTTIRFRPLHPFVDFLQSNLPFIMLSDTYKPELEQHSCVFWEHDDTETVNLT